MRRRPPPRAPGSRATPGATATLPVQPASCPPRGSADPSFVAPLGRELPFEQPGQLLGRPSLEQRTGAVRRRDRLVGEPEPAPRRLGVAEGVEGEGQVERDRGVAGPEVGRLAESGYGPGGVTGGEGLLT